VQCRGRNARIKRAKFLAARKKLIKGAEKKGLLLPMRRGGRWSEKLLTLTAPHVPGDTVAGRVKRVADAWGHLLRRVNAHWRGMDARTANFFRCLEWTPGDDGAGHPHIHVWLFCPFLDRSDLLAWWRDALLRAGLPAELANLVVLDVRELIDPTQGAQELIKYLTKDIDAQGKKIAPEVYAEVYKAFDGRRMTQPSSGFMALAEQRPNRCECGTELPKRVSVKRPRAPAAAKKPLVLPPLPEGK
jgi:hypothetical protein